MKPYWYYPRTRSRGLVETAYYSWEGKTHADVHQFATHLWRDELVGPHEFMDKEYDIRKNSDAPHWERYPSFWFEEWLITHPEEDQYFWLG